VREGNIFLKIPTMFNKAKRMEINGTKFACYIYGTKETRRIGLEGCFHFLFQNLEDGIKYLGFNPKPNNYKKEDWYWLFSRIEKTISSWCNRWLSTGGILVLKLSWR